MTDMQRPEREQDVQAAASAGTSNQPCTSSDDAISRRRRGLLKAAASAAPFIATLPSGEALAAASAPHCVINRQNGRDTPSPVVFDPVPPGDHYIRIPGSVQDYLIFDASVGFGPITVFRFTIESNPVTVVGDNPQNTSAAPRGTWVDPGLLTTPINPAQPAQFLYLYNTTRFEVVDPETDVAVGADGFPSDCTISSPDWPSGAGAPPKPASCFYPFAVQAEPTAQPGNIPLTHSCLLSFQSP
jgi:hypothetical protein